MKKIIFGRTRVLIQNLCGYRPVFFKENQTYGIHLDTAASKAYTVIFDSESSRDNAISSIDKFLDNDQTDLLLEGVKNN